MEEIILAFLGPYANWAMGLTFGVVLIKRRSIRKVHITMLLGLTVLAFIAFFAVLVIGMARWTGSPALFQGLLAAIALTLVVSSSAIGFWLILKSVGLVPDED